MLPEDVVKRLAQHYGVTVVKKAAEEYESDLKEIEKEGEAQQPLAVEKEKLQERLPVVVVMGHVDHGKTTLLDFIRKTRVAAKEKGGITQHLGAYEVKTPHGGIVFLDTPGHEAFTKIRMRGAKVADIAVLVIAADDSIMPQTIEAIRHAKAMEVPIVVAINKVDKVEQHQIEAVKRDLSQHDLLPEDWGGQIVCAPISAKLGQGIDHLLEMISLQAQVMGLEADKSASARGYILESKLEKGRGAVATLICQHGTIKKGDYFICGETTGRVNSLVDSYGKRVASVGPSIPVRVAGFSELPEAGDFLTVVSQKEYKKFRSGKSGQKVGSSKIAAVEGDINLLIKADTKSSREALLGAIAKLSKKLEKGFHIVHSAVGDVSEGDVALASTTGSIIVGLHVKVEPNAALLARRNTVETRLFGIIYKLVEDLEELSESKKEIKKVKTKIGEAVVLRVFNIKNVGVIAGCAVKEGRCSRNSTLVIWRGKTKVGEGKIKSLQREKKTVKEVHAGFECGFLVDGLDDWEVDDRVECYLEVAEEKK
ncbi:translation initiation factor IF-2 [Candidatus Dependentiae bacterium]